MDAVSQRLPHRFPFRLIDRRDENHVVVALSAGAVWGRGETPYPGPLMVEIMAQAAMALLDGPPAGDRAFLAGVEDLVVERAPRPGELLQATAEVQARFGGTIKVLARLSGEARVGVRIEEQTGAETGDPDGDPNGGQEIARAALLLVLAPG